MPSLTPREQRTVRIGLIAISLYLVFFFGVSSWKFMEARRTDYLKVYKEAQHLKQEFQPYETRALLIAKLKEKLNLNTAKLSKATVVSESSAAIVKAGMASGLQIGPIRESPARSSAKELASVQIEGMGQAQGVLVFLHQLQTLGFPLILDSIQITPDLMRPGMIKLSLTLIILDYEQWTAPEEVRHA